MFFILISVSRTLTVVSQGSKNKKERKWKSWESYIEDWRKMEKLSHFTFLEEERERERKRVRVSDRARAEVFVTAVQ